MSKVPFTSKSSTHIDQLRETELQTSIFRDSEERMDLVDFQRIREALRKDRSIPAEVAQGAVRHIQEHMHALGLDQPSLDLVATWLRGLLREQGYTLSETSLQSLEMSLSDVELNIYHPVGLGAGATQNPEATSQKIAQRIKAQFARKRVYQDDVVAAHDAGDLELLHAGAVDRPHDIFLTPDYLKIAGLPVTGHAPAAGPARHAEVLLAHLIRFTHELQNHFAGEIHWGYVNTQLLPYLEDLGNSDLHQFVQQMLFEFSQLAVERGGLSRRVVLDFDLDLPPPVGRPARLPGRR